MSNLPPAPQGALIYTHPQGKTIYLMPDNSMVVYKPDGKRGTSSATPAKLVAGHGGWELQSGSPSTVVAAPVAPPPSAVRTMIYPQLAQQSEVTSLEAYINDPTWVMEQKVDGHRILLCSPGGDYPPTSLTRNGTPYTKGLPKAVKDFRFPMDKGANDWILDGELVGSQLWLFDLPASPISHVNTPLSGRRAALETMLSKIEHPFKLVPQARTRDEKIKLASTALAENFEGLVLKRADSVYRSGARNGDWLKVKFVKTADCVVLDVRDDGKDSVKLGLYQDTVVGPHQKPTQILVEVGRSSLIGKEKAGVINKGDVIEVRYLYTGAGGRLYQPTILRKRDDKRPDECTTDQMVFVNKEVLEAL